jgi:CheY-like chemotaxis protein
MHATGPHQYLLRQGRNLRDLLTSADYEMTEAVNGEEALASVAKQRPDLI